MNVILIGFQNVGKTSVGKQLASHLQKKFIDTDELIEAHYAAFHHEYLSVRDIWKQRGEIYFRQLEQEVIADLYPKEESIIAVGGGCVINQKNAAQLKQLGKIVYLSIHYAELVARNAAQPKAAFLTQRSFASIYAERLPIYLQLADIQFVTDLQSVAQIVKGLKPLLEE